MTLSELDHSSPSVGDGECVRIGLNANFKTLKRSFSTSREESIRTRVGLIVASIPKRSLHNEQSSDASGEKHMKYMLNIL